MINEIDVTSVSRPDVTGSLNLNDNFTTGTFTYPYSNQYNYSWAYTTTVYMYQLLCPRCSESNWGEVDKIVICKGKLRGRPCKAKLKAVTQKVDYEVTVG